MRGDTSRWQVDDADTGGEGLRARLDQGIGATHD